MGLTVTSSSRAKGLAGKPDRRALDVCLAIRPCHESVINKYKKKYILKYEIKKKGLTKKKKNKAKRYSNE